MDGTGPAYPAAVLFIFPHIFIGIYDTTEKIPIVSAGLPFCLLVRLSPRLSLLSLLPSPSPCPSVKALLEWALINLKRINSGFNQRQPGHRRSRDTVG